MNRKIWGGWLLLVSFFQIQWANVSPKTNDPFCVDFISACIVHRVTREEQLPKKYYFKFRNCGTEPVLVIAARGSDPDFPFYYPKHPVGIGKEDSIGIILADAQQKIPLLHRQYMVEFAGNRRVQLTLVRVMKCDCEAF
jgi:hypothetical protein